MTDVRRDSDEVRYLCERDWRFARLVAYMGDLEYRRAGSAFEALAHSIVEQMLSMKAAARIDSRIREACGGNLAPGAVAALSVQDLRACGISNRKAESLLALARNAGQVVCSLWRPCSSTAVRYLYRALNDGLVKQGSPEGILW